jgi:hypothetical protein
MKDEEEEESLNNLLFVGTSSEPWCSWCEEEEEQEDLTWTHVLIQPTLDDDVHDDEESSEEEAEVEDAEIFAGTSLETNIMLIVAMLQFFLLFSWSWQIYPRIRRRERVVVPATVANNYCCLGLSAIKSHKNIKQ